MARSIKEPDGVILLSVSTKAERSTKEPDGEKMPSENTKETLPEQQRCCCYNMSSSEITPKTLMSQSHNKIEPL